MAAVPTTWAIVTTPVPPIPVMRIANSSSGTIRAGLGISAGGCGKAGGSLFAYWTERCKLEITGADETIRAVNLEGGDARQLGVKPGAAGLRVEATGFLESGEPLWWERTDYRGDAYEFHNRLGGIQAARPAVGVLS